MQRLFQLAKVLRVCAQKDRKIENKNNSAVGSSKALFAPVIGVAIVVGLFFLTNHFSDVITAMGGSSLLLTAVLMIIGLVCVILTFIELINTLYMSSDMTALIVLPFSSSQIAGARIFNASFRNYIIAALIAVPSLLGYGLAVNASLGYYLVGLIGIVLVPLFILLATAALVILIMSFVRVFRNRDVLSILGVILVFIGLVIYFNFATNNNSALSDLGNGVLAGMETISGLAACIPVVPMLVGFYESGNALFLLSALGIILVTLVILAIFVKVFYLKGAMAVYSGTQKRKVIKDLGAISQKRSTRSALTRRDLRSFFRTPAFFLNGWIITLFWPVLLIIPLVFQGGFENLMALGSADVEGLDTLYPLSTAIGCAASLGLAALLSALNNLAFTSFSRDGQSFFWNKVIPAPMRTQVVAKRNAALVVCLIGTTLYTLILACIGVFWLHIFPIWAIIPIVLASAAGTILISNLQMWLGSRQLNIDWTDESAVGKASSVILVIAVFVAEFGAMILLLLNLKNIDPNCLTGGIVIVSVLAAIITNSLLIKATTRNLEQKTLD